MTLEKLAMLVYMATASFLLTIWLVLISQIVLVSLSSKPVNYEIIEKEYTPTYTLQERSLSRKEVEQNVLYIS